MGVKYYDFKEPITYFRIIKEGLNYRVEVFVHHQNVGHVLLRDKELFDFIDLFIDFDKPIYYSYWAGKKKGIIIERWKKSDNKYVVSEYGDIFSVEEMENQIAEM